MSVLRWELSGNMRLPHLLRERRKYGVNERTQQVIGGKPNSTFLTASLTTAYVDIVRHGGNERKKPAIGRPNSTFHSF